MEHDPYLAQIITEKGREYLAEMLDVLTEMEDPGEVDYMLDLPCTPLNGLFNIDITSVKNPCVLMCPGSFNPPHSGHFDMMNAAKAIAEKAGYTVLHGYISPGHDTYIKEKSGNNMLPIWERIALCEKMCDKWMSVCPWEGLFNKHALLFTHVIERLQRYILKNTGLDIPVFFVCGMDNEKYTKTFIYKGHCIVVDRPHTTKPYVYYGGGYLDRVLYAPLNNDNSSSRIRQNTRLKKADKVNLTIRVEDDHHFPNNSYQPLLDIVSKEYDKVTVNLLSDQRKVFDKIKNTARVLSLDSLLEGHDNLQVSRHYDRFGCKMLRFDNSPETDQTLTDQLNSIEPGPVWLFDDDIHTTGGTIRYMSGLLDEVGVTTESVFTLKVSDSSQGEILDLRDFLIHPDNSGLVINLDATTAVRAPYIYPYTCPFARASITNPMLFSIKVWKFNRDYWMDKLTTVKELGSMGVLFIRSGFATEDMTVAHMCMKHMDFLFQLYVSNSRTRTMVGNLPILHKNTDEL